MNKRPFDQFSLACWTVLLFAACLNAHGAGDATPDRDEGMEQLFNSAVAHQQKQNYDQAIREYREIILKDPNAPRAWESLERMADIYLALGNMGKARKLLMEFRKYPDYPGIDRVNRKVRENTVEPETSRNDVRPEGKPKAADRTALPTYYYQSVEDVYRGNHQKVRQRINELKPSHKNDPYLQLLELNYTDNYKTIISQGKAILAEHGDIPEVYDCIAMHYYLYENKYTGLQWMRKGLSIFPDHPLLNSNCCFMLRKLAEENPANRAEYLREAFACGQRAVENEKQVPASNIRGAIHFNLGICYEMLGDKAAAQAQYEDALNYNPNHPYARRKLKSL